MMRRTTIVADEDLLMEIKQVARAEGRSASELIREALEQYIRTKRAKDGRVPSFVGLGKSGRSDISERIDELLWEERRQPNGPSPA